MTLGYLTIDSLFDPSYLINQFVSKVLHHLESESILGIDYPNEEESISLQLIERNVEDLLIIQSVICDSNTSCWIST